MVCLRSSKKACVGFGRVWVEGGYDTIYGVKGFFCYYVESRWGRKGYGCKDLGRFNSGLGEGGYGIAWIYFEGGVYISC